jgi:hypothetical protein
MMKVSFHSKTQSFDISVNAEEGKWLVKMLDKVSVYSDSKVTFFQIKVDFEQELEDFELFWYSKPMLTLRSSMLLVL